MKEKSFMEKLAAAIVDGRRLIVILTLCAAVFSVFSIKWVNVTSDIYTLMPEDTETILGVRAMEGEFITYHTARVMLENISYEDAQAQADEIAALEGIKSVAFDDSEEHYKSRCAEFDITFCGVSGEEECEKGVTALEEKYADNENATIFEQSEDELMEYIMDEVVVIGAAGAAVVLVALLFTSTSYAEVLVYALTFGAAALINMGTNFVFDSVYVVSNAVTVIMQLALAIDYAVILNHRFREEQKSKRNREALIAALSKAIPEISASSLTTIGGLFAMTFMEFGLGADLGRVLIKAIIFSMLSVFLLMPALLMGFAKAIKRTTHRSFIPKMRGAGRFAWKTRNIIPPIFVLLIVVSFFGAQKIQLSYNYNDTYPARLNATQEAKLKIEEEFGSRNTVALIIPSDDYEQQLEFIGELEKLDHVTEVLGLANVQATDGYRLCDKLTTGEFAQIAGLDDLSAKALYAYYAAHTSDYESVQDGLDNYKIPMIDLFEFLYEMTENGSLDLDEDKKAMIEDLNSQLLDAKAQLQGREYCRILLYLDIASVEDEAVAMVSTLHNMAAERFGDDVYVVGEVTSTRDMQDFFQRDLILTSVLSALFVFIVTLFTFRSFGLSLLVVAVIQGSIWINFSFPFSDTTPMFFVAYMIVSSIQMGANVDYAIVLSNRYLQLREVKSRRAAASGALNGALPTLLTSGTILTMAGYLLGYITSEQTTSAIGIALGRGTLISMLLVLFVLPQMLIWGDKFISKTSFSKSDSPVIKPLFDPDFEEAGRDEMRNLKNK